MTELSHEEELQRTYADGYLDGFRKALEVVRSSVEDESSEERALGYLEEND